MASGNFFNGSFSRRPRVVAKVDDAGLIPFQIGSPNIVAILGIGEGGVPGEPKLYNTPTDAARDIRAGELLTAVQYAFNPSTGQNGAALVYVVRVNPATKATLALKDGSANAVIDVSSVNYGKQDNQIKIKVENGTIKGKKVTVAKGAALYARDNIWRDSFSIDYIGAGTVATLTLDGTTLTTVVTDGLDPIVADQLNLDLNNFPTIQSVVDFINATGKYTAVVKTTNPNQSPLNSLDFATAQDITTVYTVTANLQAVIDWLNSGQQPLVTAARASGAGAAPANVGYTYLAGGTEGTTLTSHWQAALDALQLLDVSALVVVTGDAALHALADGHCQQMSLDGRRPRRCYVGGVLGEHTPALTNYTDRAAALNSSRAVLVAQGIGGFDANGQPVTYAPYIAAAMIAGLQSGVAEIGDSITHASVRVTSLEWNPTDSEQEILISGGVLVMEQVQNQGIFRVVRGISTWLQTDAFDRVEISTGMALDQVVRDIIDGLDIFIGQKGSPVLVHRVASRVESLLIQEQNAGVIVGDAASPAFKNIQVSLAGDVVSVAFECSPVIPVNFINVTVHANAFTGATSIAVG